ncbi:Lipoprotein releasing system transmembrane protein LolE [Klebsiella pneumoniae ISC21]|nr:Lipoprotein releasing system transmembrane protein LolE [Klebsiella pneumoniae ISC21]
MASPLSLLIALRFSRGRRRGGMVSLISVISTIGIALGGGGADRRPQRDERL